MNILAQRAQDYLEDIHYNTDKIYDAKLFLLVYHEYGDFNYEEQPAFDKAKTQLTVQDIDDFQQFMDKATYQYRHEDLYKALPHQVQYVSEMKAEVNYENVLVESGGNKEIVNYLVVDMNIPISEQTKNRLYARDHNEALELIAKRELHFDFDKKVPQKQEVKHKPKLKI